LKWESAAEELSLRHSAKCGFRTYDVLHVAAAKELGCQTFYSYDIRCNKLASLEGLDVPLKTSLRLP
jgi:predicted nucleic acid-binding protein